MTNKDLMLVDEIEIDIRDLLAEIKSAQGKFSDSFPDLKPEFTAIEEACYRFFDRLDLPREDPDEAIRHLEAGSDDDDDDEIGGAQ